LVLSNSQAAAATVPSAPENLIKWRDDLIQQQILVARNECLILARDYVFPSASAAACVFLGRNANGRVVWKDADGRPLKAIQEGRRRPEEVLKAKLKRIERKIAKIERFEVTISYHGDEESLPPYDYKIAANKDLTVAQWRDQRFKYLYPDCDVIVLLSDGKEAYGGTKLATVRDSYVS
jgi:hypothetical protein